jgi:hypothetical protein
METYINWVVNNPLLSAAIQFAILGTLGEVISFSIQQKRPAIPCTWFQLFGKLFAWAFLGIIIKYGFAVIPAVFGAGIGWAFAVSVFTNILFGPQMMAFHRLEDNLILGNNGFQGITKAWWTLVWFWIPAHTITFMLPPNFQIGLAAAWSLVLGLIMGFSKKKTI